MSTKYLFAAMKARTDNPVAKLILIYLADCANENGVCWPAHSTIAENCECSIATVKRQIDGLIVKGYIDLQNRSHKGFKTSNVYTIINPDSIRTNGKPAIAQIEPTIAHSELTDSSERAIEPISNLPIKESISKARNFVPPTIEQAQAYANEKGWSWRVSKFVDWHEGKGWMIGKSKAVDWKAMMRTWNGNEEDRNNGRNTTGTKGNIQPDRHKTVADKLRDKLAASANRSGI